MGWKNRLSVFSTISANCGARTSRAARRACARTSPRTSGGGIPSGHTFPVESVSMSRSVVASSAGRGNDRRGQFPEMVSIHVRPPEVDDGVMPGHWEGDFIKGAGNKSSVGVLVERTSRLVLLAKMDDATAASALAGFSAKLNSIAAPMRQTLTYDQGKEMSR